MRKTPIVAAFVLSLGLALVPSASAADTLMGVAGHGSVVVQPDLATLSVGIERKATSSQVARRRADAVATRLIGAVVAAGVPRTDITTTQVAIDRIVRHRSRKPAVVTYVGIYDLSIRTRRVDLLSQLFSILTRAKVDYEGPSFDLADPTGADIRARDVALDDARRRADDAAARIGMSVVGVRNVNLNPELIGTSLPSGDEGQALFPERAPAAGGSPSTGVTVKRTPIAGGTIEVSADVIVIYVLG